MKKKQLEIDVTEFAQAVRTLVRRVRSAAASQEYSLTEAAVMARLENHGPTIAAALARAEGMKPQSMGTIIASLERMGVAARKPHPTDGRQVNIELTAKGAAACRTVREAKRTWLAKAIAQLDKKDRETLFEAGKIIRRLADNDRQ
jgi:DNA-binding MarR family transcriptional regulator